MSNVEAVTKVADQIISRIFDHRQFTCGEINYIARELGEKCNLEANFDKILKINENVCLISDKTSEDLCNGHDNKTRDVCDQVTSLLERTQRILKIEDEQTKREEQTLGDKRRQSEKLRQESVVNSTMKLERLKESLVQEELDLERKYLKFEDNLRNR